MYETVNMLIFSHSTALWFEIVGKYRSKSDNIGMILCSDPPPLKLQGTPTRGPPPDDYYQASHVTSHQTGLQFYQTSKYRSITKGEKFEQLRNVHKNTKARLFRIHTRPSVISVNVGFQSDLPRRFLPQQRFNERFRSRIKRRNKIQPTNNTASP